MSWTQARYLLRARFDGAPQEGAEKTRESARDARGWDETKIRNLKQND